MVSLMLEMGTKASLSTSMYYALTMTYMNAGLSVFIVFILSSGMAEFEPGILPLNSKTSNQKMEFSCEQGHLESV